jgi:hypothetical protein
MRNSGDCRGCTHRRSCRNGHQIESEKIQSQKIRRPEIRKRCCQRRRRNDTIVGIISRETGASANEILAALTKRFPDREPDKMRNTIGTQVSRHATSKKSMKNAGRSTTAAVVCSGLTQSLGRSLKGGAFGPAFFLSAILGSSKLGYPRGFRAGCDVCGTLINGLCGISCILWPGDRRKASTYEQ